MGGVTDYRIGSVIGRGGSSVVYRADGVALKVLRDDLRDVPGVLERFNNDAAVAAAVEHPNVVAIHEAGDGWLAMELVEGPSLRELAPLPPARAAALVAQVADALDAVHAAGYVHRDVKPGNVLVGPGDRAVLIDFALARPIESAEPWVTAEGKWLGTPEFAAPEQVRGRAMDARSEVYSLGALLYWTVTAELPSPPRPGTPFHAVVARAMAPDPTDRYASAGELALALSAT